MSILDKIYAELPRLKCKGKCADSCGPIAVAPVEWEAMGKPQPAREIGGNILIGPHFAGESKLSLDCPLLVAGKCSIYDRRPLICRTWGATKKMRCPWGCKPKRWIKNGEFMALFNRLKGMIRNDRDHQALPAVFHRQFPGRTVLPDAEVLEQSDSPPRQSTQTFSRVSVIIP